MKTYNDLEREPIVFDDALGKYLASVGEELKRASQKFGPFNSAIEGLAILEEEVDEFKQEVRHGTIEKARAEAIQVAAMAVRFLMDCYKVGK